MCSFNDVQKLMGARWKSMTAEERQPYEQLALEEKNRFLTSAEGQEMLAAKKLQAQQKKKEKAEEERQRLELERAQKREEDRKKREEKRKIELEEKQKKQEELRIKDELKYLGKQIIPGLYLGNRHVAKNTEWMLSTACRYVVNVTSELKNHYEVSALGESPFT